MACLNVCALCFQETLIEPVRRQLEYYEAQQKEDLKKAASSSSINSATVVETETPSSGPEAGPENGVANDGDGTTAKT